MRGRGDLRGRGRGRGRGGGGGGRTHDRHGDRSAPTQPVQPLTPEQIIHLQSLSTLSLNDPHYRALSSLYPHGPSESQCGLTHYLTGHVPFSAMIKQWPHDFHVNEIDQSNNVVTLTSLALAADDTNTATTTITNTDASASPDAIVANNVGEPLLLSLLSNNNTILEAFKAWILAEYRRYNEWRATHPQPKKPVAGEFVFNADLSKEERTRLHGVLRDHYSTIVSDVVDTPSPAETEPKIDSIEVTEPSAKRPRLAEDAPSTAALPMKYVRARCTLLTKKVDRDHRDDSFYPRTRPHYCHFTLHKHGTSTMEALSLLASALNVNQKFFQSAGTKDKRAVTSQRISAHKMLSTKLAKINSHPHCKQLKVGNYEYLDDGLKLGRLNGNQFQIVLRDIHGTDAVTSEKLNAIFDSIKSHGFVNYYGMQRFGSGSIPTHLIGLAIIKGDYREACALLLCPRHNERIDITEARQYLADTSDFTGTLSKIPKFLRTERSVLASLCDRRNDYLNALMTVPRGLRLMFVHAWQSYVWNHMVSKRFELLPHHPVVGDIVLIKTTNAVTDTNANFADETMDDTEGEEDVGDEVTDSYSPDHVPHILTDTDIQSGTYCLRDVVLPLPGVDTVYPTNILGSHYLSFMAVDDITVDTLAGTKTSGASKDFLLRGSYRRMIEVPKNFTAEMFDYSDARVSYFQSDYEKLTGKSLSGFPASDSGSSSDGRGPFTGIALKFELPSSTYATCLIRELTHHSTSVHNQKSLNQKHKQKLECTDADNDASENTTNSNDGSSASGAMAVTSSSAESVPVTFVGDASAAQSTIADINAEST